MKDLLKNWNTYVISESSLSRVHKHLMDHDCAIITAFRNDPDDKSLCASPDDEENEEESIDESKKKTLSKNKLRNRNLKAALLSSGYGITNVLGSYIENFMKENAVEVKEDSLFVVNLEDDEGFFDTIEKLGRIFCQDSVLMIPKGGKGAYLLGTNNSDFPGLGNKVESGDFLGGQEHKFMSRVSDRPFTFKENKEYNLETYSDIKSKNARWAIKLIAKKVLK